MLARASSDAGTRLRRSKSTSTVYKRPPSITEPLDLDAVKQQALAAATAAFARAHANDVAEGNAKRKSETSRSKSSASRKSLTSQGSHFPPRGSSFRSMQSQKTVQAGTTPRSARLSTTADTEQFPPFYPTPSTERPTSASRPLSTQSSKTISENARPSSQPKPFRQSASSSVASQQIRKARSMYYASSVQTGSPIARPPAKYLITPPPLSTSPALEHPHVLPATRTIRPSPLAGPRVPITIAPNETVDAARDKYLQSFQQKTVKHKPSMFLAPFKKRQDKGKEHGKRAVSSARSSTISDHQTPEDSTTNDAPTDFMPRPEIKEKRSLSGSLKSKFRKVFRRTSNKSTELPVQQIDASREYFQFTHLSPSDTVDPYAIPSPDEKTLQRVRARTPSYDGVRPPFVRPGSRSSSNGSARSNRSLHSETNATHVSTSRVTSWGTSSTTDTLTQGAMKRLTVIHEAKDSIGSEADHLASMMPRRKSLPPPPLASFRDPMPMDSLVEESSTPIDPKRVFSALMKELGTSGPTELYAKPAERTPGAESDVFESSSTKLHSQVREQQSNPNDARTDIDVDQRPPSRRPQSAAGSTQAKTSTIRSLGRAIKSTIRTVTPAEQRSSYLDHMAMNPSVEQVPRPVVSECDGNPRNINQNANDLAQMARPSAEQIEKRVERAKDRWKTPLDEAEHLQFPRETDRTYDVVNLSQRACSYRSPRTSIEHPGRLQANTDSDDQYITIFSKSPHVPVSPPPRSMQSPLSPSLYSRNTDGVSILPNDSVMSLESQAELERSHNGGSAVISTSQSVRSYVVGTPSPCRPSSTRTSRDWRAWLSHEVSSMETTSHEDLTIQERNVTPSVRPRSDTMRMSHTEQDDTTVILRGSCDTTITRLNYEGSLTKDVPEIDGPSSNTELDQPPSSVTLSNKPTVSHVGYETPRPSQTNGSGGNSGDRTLVRDTASTIDIAASLELSNPRNSTSTSGFHSRHTASPTDDNSQRVPHLALKRSDAQHKRKENVTPPSMRGKNKSHASPLGLAPRPHSQQRLSPVASNRTTPSASHDATYAAKGAHAKNYSSTAATPPRPRIRATLRPMSPEKLARRPKSAFDLRGTNVTSRPIDTGLNTPARRPGTEIRRPALNLKSSSSSLATIRDVAPDGVSRNDDAPLNDERGESITPGQRMADRFLKQRKSTTALESDGRLRGGLWLVREDTPAFL